MKVTQYDRYAKMIKIEIPLKTVSEANRTSEHWSQKHKRHKAQRNIVRLMIKPHLDKISLPCKIVLTRIAPRKLDKHDNLPMAFKTILDELAELITGQGTSGRGDADPRITVEYIQEKGEVKQYGIKIEIVHN